MKKLIQIFFLLPVILFLGNCKEPSVKKFNHAMTLFPLTGAHMGVNCRECHKDGSITSISSDCQSCHPMNFNHTANTGDCNLCHSTATFSAPFFNHTRAGFNVKGAHIKIVIGNCKSCHKANVYAGVPWVCSNCHNPPSPDFCSADAPVHAGALDCESCHNQVTFQWGKYDRHNSFATKLYGGHSNIACSACHSSPRGNCLSSIIYRDGTAYGSCANCHTRNYRGNEHHSGLPTDANCGKCHGYSGFHGG